DRQYRKPSTNGTMTPTTATAPAAGPFRSIAFRSVSRPISNSSTTTPTCASSRNTPVSGSSGAVGITRRTPAPSTIPARSSPITAGWRNRSNASPANLPTRSITARISKKRATSRSPPPAAALKRLSSLGMEVERVVEEGQVDRLGVFRLDHDLPRRRPAHDPHLLGLGREPDVRGRRLDAAADRAVIERRRQLRLRLHLVEQPIVPEEQLADVDAVVQRTDKQEQREEAAQRARAAAAHHCDWAPSTRSWTSFWSAALRPFASCGGE